MSTQRAVFLDRDGVINRPIVRSGKPYAPRFIEDFFIFPGVSASVKMLKNAGFLVIVVTNQPDIGNGLVPESSVDAMHRKLRQKVDVDDILLCPHRQADLCECRKPRIGMLLAASQKYGIDLGSSVMVGDRLSDIHCGLAAGASTIFVKRGQGYGENSGAKIPAQMVANSLPDAVRQILSKFAKISR